MYYNTTNLTRTALDSAHTGTKTQEDKIKMFFNFNPGEVFTPDEIMRGLRLQGVPLTSIRRAVTNLTNEGVLEKTMTKKIGMYGKLSYCWRLREGQDGLL